MIRQTSVTTPASARRAFTLLAVHAHPDDESSGTGGLLRLAAEQGIDPALLHRVAVIGSGTLDTLPHNGAVVTLLAVCGTTHRESYLDIVMVAIVGALLALAVVIALGSAFGSF